MEDFKTFVLSAKNILDKVFEQYQKQEAKIQETNLALYNFKVDAYKDKQMHNMKKSLDEMSEDYHRGFPISKQEKERIHKWIEGHENKIHGGYPCYHGVNGGGYTYEFYPTGIGTGANIVCNRCRRRAFKEAAGNFNNYEKLIEDYDASFKFQELGEERIKWVTA